MPKLTPYSEALRVADAIRVLQLIASGMKQSEACKEVGISTQTFKYWLSKGDDALEAFRELIESVERQQLALMASAKLDILQKILASADGPYARPTELLAIAKYLDAQVEDLASKYNAVSRGDDQGTQYLQGPELRKGKSRFGARMNIAPLPDGSFDITVEKPDQIIDVEPRDEQHPRGQ